MKDGIIDLDSEKGKDLGFTSDKFEGYLWKHGRYIYISFIISKQQGEGNLSQLFTNIESKGYGIKVPTPFARMTQILLTHGFTPTKEWFKQAGDYAEVWVKKPK